MDANPRWLALLAPMLLTGCLMTHAEALKVRDAETTARKARQAEIDRYLPTCITDAECATLWQAAIDWAAAHPRKTVLTAKSNRITVLFNGDPTLGMDIRLKHLGQVRYLDTTVSCTSWNLCGPAPDALRLEFNKALYPVAQQP